MSVARELYEAQAMAADDKYAKDFIRVADLYERKLGELADRHEREHNRALGAYVDTVSARLVPGAVMDTEDGLWFARVSRSDLPLRLTPADLTNEGGLKTLPVDEFFNRYPLARVVFNAGKYI